MINPIFNVQRATRNAKHLLWRNAMKLNLQKRQEKSEMCNCSNLYYIFGAVSFFVETISMTFRLANTK